MQSDDSGPLNECGSRNGENRQEIRERHRKQAIQSGIRGVLSIASATIWIGGVVYLGATAIADWTGTELDVVVAAPSIESAAGFAAVALVIVALVLVGVAGGFPGGDYGGGR